MSSAKLSVSITTCVAPFSSKIISVTCRRTCSLLLFRTVTDVTSPIVLLSTFNTMPTRRDKSTVWNIYIL